MRLKMLNDIPVESCKACYTLEAAGATSLRTKSNFDFSHHLNLAQKTNDDGSLNDFRLRYIDIRFSNLCNLRCRTCCPDLSSAIASDVAKMHSQPIPRPINVYQNKEEFLKDFLPHIPYIEEIYFAGGEPLLMDAHYWALEELISQGQTNIRLRYNTNFMTLGKGKWQAPNFWKYFKIFLLSIFPKFVGR